MKRYMKYIKPYWVFFVLSPIMMILEIYCDVKIPTLASEIINVGIANSDAGEVVSLTLVMLGFVLLAVITGTCASYCASKASVFFATDLRSDIFKKIQSFSFANIDSFSTGSLVTRLTNDITQIQQLVVVFLRMAFRAPGMLVGALYMSYMISSKIAVIFVVIVPILATIIILVLKYSYPRFAKLQERVDDLNSNIREILTNVRIVKALTREGYEIEKFNKVNNNLKETGLSAYRITILQMPIMTLVVNMATIMIMWYGSQLLGKGELLIGSISALITYMTQILMSVNMLANVFLQSSRAMASEKRIAEVLDADIDIVDNLDSEYRVQSGDIRFEHVDFKYYKNNKELVLSDITVDIKAGQTIGIIGSTGCGKTSFIHLIPRLYDVDQGNVYVGGIDVKDYSLKNLRDGVAVVLQNNVLFSGTIEENLKWGDKTASNEEMEQVAAWSAANEFIDEKPLKYQDIVDQGGLNLSGGQKQRLCIARALLKKPKILILDDSTSAVDTATEASIRGYLASELKETTKLIIAQRISSVIEADKILVMNDGKIEAFATHDELMETSITYKEIYQSQMSQEVQA
ncbi:MAG: ABC transporter ATP-binding protein [Lachnospiraceae bacterium]